MQFSKLGNMYRVARMTGSQDNILGVVFCDNKAEKINLIEWQIKEGATINASGEQVLEQVQSGLKKANEALSTSYQLSEIHFLPSDSAANAAYEFLTQALIKHYHTGCEFTVINNPSLQ